MKKNIKHWPGVILINADSNCTQIKCEAIVSDPPWGIGYFHSGGSSGKTSTLKGDGAMQAKAKSYAGNKPFILGDDVPFDPTPWLCFKTVIFFGANHFAQKLPPGRWITWDKIVNPKQYGKLSFSDCEMIWANKKGPSRIYKQLWQGCRREGECNREGKLHPNQKPIRLMQWLMDELSIPADATVCDPFMGSGTTGIACIRSGRKFIGIEKDHKHFMVAISRIERELSAPQLI